MFRTGGDRCLPSVWAWILGAILVILAVLALISLLNLEDDGAGDGLGMGQPLLKTAGYVVAMDASAAPAG